MDANEKKRLTRLSKYEKKAYKEGFKIIAGIDEAGRGPFAGPVVAAACILPPSFRLEGINDSKKMTPQKREKVFQTLTTHSEVCYGIGIIDHIQIDAINIYQASLQAMLQAINQLTIKPDLLLVDGLALRECPITAWKIIDGDALSISIGAASIIAKVTRDRLMNEYHLQWPEYGFQQHKGYSTALHLKAIETHGPCPIHRMSFEPLKSSEAIAKLKASAKSPF